jgi:uncharacterized membrane protein
MMAQRANEFGASLLSAMDVVEEQLAAQGNPVLMERAAMLHREAAQALG